MCQVIDEKGVSLIVSGCHQSSEGGMAEIQSNGRRSGEAVGAFVMGLLGVFSHDGGFIAVPIIATVLSVWAIMGIRRNPEQRGKVLAWIGLILGAVFTFVGVMTWVYNIRLWESQSGF